MNNVHLMGADSVERAGSSIANAATELSRAAEKMMDSASKIAQVHRDMEFTLMNHQRFMNDWLDRFDGVLEDKLPPSGEPIDVRVVNADPEDEDEEDDSPPKRPVKPPPVRRIPDHVTD